MARREERLDRDRADVAGAAGHQDLASCRRTLSGDGRRSSERPAARRIVDRGRRRRRRSGGAGVRSPCGTAGLVGASAGAGVDGHRHRSDRSRRGSRITSSRRTASRRAASFSGSMASARRASRYAPRSSARSSATRASPTTAIELRGSAAGDLPVQLLRPIDPPERQGPLGLEQQLDHVAVLRAEPTERAPGRAGARACSAPGRR